MKKFVFGFILICLSFSCEKNEFSEDSQKDLLKRNISKSSIISEFVSLSKSETVLVIAENRSTLQTLETKNKPLFDKLNLIHNQKGKLLSQLSQLYGKKACRN
ncbi:hypothetical protein [Sediminibacterium salmoneum]|uniref:hypothetical protein n=1 Tax=Sediminibacterium salmoneum TaxID=426421 RepID=UPI00047B7B23|nr:hypothetical protein [Sediminibacterium salmoneum]